MRPSALLARAGLLALTIPLAALGAEPTRKPRRPPPELPPLEAPVTGNALQVVPGFRVELLYQVPRDREGSWVALTVDPQGRLIAADQYGGLFRIRPPALGSAAPADVEPLETGLSGAHGVLSAHGSLYVVINESEPGGLYRLRDLDGKGRYGSPELILPLDGGKEHGPHSVLASPDGRSLYVVSGNFTEPPARLRAGGPVAWGEDHLLPRMWDPRGHAKERYAPGGHVVRVSLDGSDAQLVAIGLRNSFDAAFDPTGELFTYDSDMEWDLGTPWYVPTRVNHVVRGADFGWRSGSARRPAYLADSLGAVIDIGPGSPTGMVFGTGARFPARYQRALFIADWTYGTLYALHLRPDGSTVTAEAEEFLSAKPLPLTDLVVNPLDGALYFATGGRRTQSALYRVSYVGAESTATAPVERPGPAVERRRRLEALQSPNAAAGDLTEIWAALAEDDRALRTVARVALEHQPVDAWAERALAETHPMAGVEALLALARRGPGVVRERLWAALERHDLAARRGEARLALLRAWELAFIRMGDPDTALRTRLAERLRAVFPADDPAANREMAGLLVYLDSPAAPGLLVPLLSVAEPAGEETPSEALIARNERYAKAFVAHARSRPDRQQIAYATALRLARTGWTPALHRDFFAWITRSSEWRGGLSLPGFVQAIRRDALRGVADPGLRAELEAASQPPPATMTAAGLLPQGPGRDYTLQQALDAVYVPLIGRDFERGQAMFQALACTACHRFGEVGSGVGPDLTGAGSRYSVHDLLQAIVEPSHVISDQYGSEIFELTDGSALAGRVVGEEGDALVLMTNPFVPDDTTRVPRSSVRARRPNPVSLMPAGLINALNGGELQDLVAYILSGGSPRDPMFRRRR
jgi:putative heme-binding domain-containing protein